jgi:hypothetical protein
MDQREELEQSRGCRERGSVTPLFEDAENQVGWAIPSPDGSRVAYYKANISSNVWLLRSFGDAQGGCRTCAVLRPDHTRQPR